MYLQNHLVSSACFLFIFLFRYGVRDEGGEFTGVLGKAEFSIASAIATGGVLCFTLFQDCFLDVYISLSESYSQGVRLQFAGNSLHSSDSRPLAAYMTLLLCIPQRNILLYKSPVFKEKHPKWPDFVLPLHLLQYFPNATIQAHCSNYNVNAPDSLLGLFPSFF